MSAVQVLAAGEHEEDGLQALKLLLTAQSHTRTLDALHTAPGT
jgi:hypothetical protein